MPSYRYLFVFLVFVVVSGCGNGFVSLNGTVTYLDDGSPLTTGTVFFDNGKNVARGKIREDGTYTVGSLSSNDGLAPGHYRVYVQATGPDPSGRFEPKILSSGPGMEATDAAAPRLVQLVQLINAKFTSAETSGLECSIDRSTKTYNIAVERSPYLKSKR